MPLSSLPGHCPAAWSEADARTYAVLESENLLGFFSICAADHVNGADAVGPVLENNPLKDEAVELLVRKHLRGTIEKLFEPLLAVVVPWNQMPVAQTTHDTSALAVGERTGPRFRDVADRDGHHLPAVVTAMAAEVGDAAVLQALQSGGSPGRRYAVAA
jgi:hypothetical protein